MHKYSFVPQTDPPYQMDKSFPEVPDIDFTVPHKVKNNIYLWLSFGLTNAIDNYLRLNNIFVYQKSLNQIFQTSFWVKKYFLNLSSHVKNIFVYQKSLKQIFQTSYWVKKYLLNLSLHVVSSQSFFLSKTGVKCSY